MRLLAALILSVVFCAAARADQTTTVPIVYIGLKVPRQPDTLLDPIPTGIGVQGARLALIDNETTGRFLNQHFTLQELIESDTKAAIDAAQKALSAGNRFIVADLPKAALLQIADLPAAKTAIVLDATNEDDSLRGADCRKNMLHLSPSRAMRADALMQYLATKQWSNILLVTGPTAEDKAFGDAFRRSARKFQIKLADDKPWTFQPGAQRTDTGALGIANEAQRFTQGEDYDVLVVADVNDDFGDDLAYRTSIPRPVAGTQGLVPTSWFPLFEQWGATQLQLRFKKLSGRTMTPRDFGAWMAVRVIGEGATRVGADPTKIIGFIESPKFEFAAFKGKRLSFRSWDGQLRQPVLLADAVSLVSVSPQPGYLHQVSELDTLGIDEPETTCHF